MLDFYDSFTVGDDNKQPYSVTLIKNDAYDHNHGFISERGYELNCSGTDHELNVPCCGNFTLSFSFCHKTSFCKDTDEHFEIYFGYKRENREGYILDIIRLSSGGTLLRLLSTEASLRRVIKEQAVKFTQQSDIKYKVKIDINNGYITVRLGNNLLTEQLETAPYGKLGFRKGKGFREIIVSDLRFKSSDCNSLYKPIKYSFVIPTDNAACLPYKLKITKRVYKDDLCRIDYVLDEGITKRSFGEVLHGEDCCWTGMKESFTAPYLRFNGGKRVYITNGTIDILEGDYEIPSEGNTVAHEVISAYNIYKATSNVITLPLKGSVMLKNLDLTNISFGYDRFYSLGSEFYGGEREFIFSKSGDILYNGEPIDKDIMLSVSSPADKYFTDRIPVSSFGYDKAVAHFEKNHYFTVDVKPEFTLSLLTKLNPEYITVKAFVLNAFLKKIGTIPDTDVKLSESAIGMNRLFFTYSLDKFNEGVYHIAFEIYYCGILKREHHSAFEVIDPESENTPQCAAGLPVIHIGDGGPNGLETACPSPWNIQSDFNIEHYVSIACLVPYNFEGKGISELLSLTKRKTLVWVTQRTARKSEVNTGKCLELETVRNADYINYLWPGIENSKNYYRYDFYTHRTYTDRMLDAVHDFIEKHTPEDYPLRKKDIYSDFSEEDYKFFISVYFSEFTEYAIPIFRRLFKEQWAEVKKINSKAKRQSYGPWNIYTSPSLGGYSAKWFGGDTKSWNEMFDGFLQLEDYPFCCSYQTNRSAWAMATAKFLCPEVKIHPELYDSFDEGCPDGAIAPAHPPLGKYNCPPYAPVTQAFEYLFNTPYIDKYGGYSYWRDYGFMLFSLFRRNPVESVDTFIRAWGIFLENKPRRPLKCPYFVYDIDKADDRYDLETGENAFYNISDANESYIYKQMRESGFPAGAICGFKDLYMLNSGNCDMLVLPSLKAVSNEAASEIRRLHDEGVPLFAVSNVGSLGDIFGVSENNRTEQTVSIHDDTESELVAPLHVEYFCDVLNGSTCLSSDAGMPVVIRTDNTALLNASICRLGVEYGTGNVTNSPRNISRLLKKTVRCIIRDLIDPICSVDRQCGITVFENERNETMLLIIDYSDYDDNLCVKEKQVTIAINKLHVTDVRIVKGITDKIGIFKADNEVKALSVSIKPHEAILIRLIKAA